MITTNKLTMDLTKHSNSPIVYAMQDDRYSRNLELTLLSHGEPWMIPEQVTVVIRYSKADGTGGEYDTLPDESSAWTANENVLTLSLAPHVLATSGTVKLSVTMIRNHIQISTFAIIICVEEAVRTDAEIPGHYFHVPGFLPAPDTAKAGQYLQVASADSHGHITGIRAVEPEMGIHCAVEPEDHDIPKVFFGSTLPQTKDDAIMRFRYISKTEDISGYCKTKAQGSSSLQYPKKNQTVELYKDADCTEELKVDFKGWGAQNKFCFKANWIDHSHARNILCANLWSEVVASRSDYLSLPEELRNSPNNGAIDGFPVKLYARGIYQGIYTLNIPKEAWMWNMDEDNANHVLLCGEACKGIEVTENYETAANFRKLWGDENDGDWSVEVGAKSDAVKASLNALISCVKDTDDETFKATLGNHLDVQSAIDYYLFVHVTLAQDNTGRNVLLATYDGIKWYCGAYDLDMAWGWHDGNVPEDCTEAHSLLWERIEKLYADELKARYAELRDTVYSYSNLISKLERFMERIGTEHYAEDLVIYPGIPVNENTTLRGFRDIIVKRRPLVDAEVASWGITEEYLYALPEVTVFDGVSTYIDTGVAPFAEAQDFTIFVDMEAAETQNQSARVLFNWSGDHTVKSLSVDDSSGFLNVSSYGEKNMLEEASNGSWEHSTKTIKAFVLVYKAGVLQYGKYRKNTDNVIRNIAAHSNNAYVPNPATMIIGAIRTADGSIARYFTGTINDMRIYNRALTDDEVVALLHNSER